MGSMTPMHSHPLARLYALIQALASKAPFEPWQRAVVTIRHLASVLNVHLPQEVAWEASLETTAEALHEVSLWLHKRGYLASARVAVLYVALADSVTRSVVGAGLRREEVAEVRV